MTEFGEFIFDDFYTKGNNIVITGKVYGNSISESEVYIYLQFNNDIEDNYFCYDEKGKESRSNSIKCSIYSVNVGSITDFTIKVPFYFDDSIPKTIISKSYLFPCETKPKSCYDPSIGFFGYLDENTSGRMKIFETYGRWNNSDPI